MQDVINASGVNTLRSVTNRNGESFRNRILFRSVPPPLPNTVTGVFAFT